MARDGGVIDACPWGMIAEGAFWLLWRIQMPSQGAEYAAEIDVMRSELVLNGQVECLLIRRLESYIAARIGRDPPR